MSERIHVLARELFGKPTVDACNLQEVKDLAQRFPFFAPAQFLLLEKLRQEQDPAYAAQLQKAVLLYPDPLRFEYFIASDRFYTEWNADEEEQTLITAIKNEEEASLQPEQMITAPAEPSIQTEPSVDSEPEQIIDDLALGQDATEAPSMHAQPKIEEEENEHSPPEETGTTEPLAPIAGLPQSSNDIPQTSSDQPAPPGQQGAPVANDLVFEPFHTVDYFASQGIRLSQEEATKDEFGKQLKSFTEWLKTMKRLPAKQAVPPVDVSTEQKVEHLAQDSVHDTSVVTEAMAEVWLKQGNSQKAVEVYQKLSLLNPSKMAYFADKIENLKHS